MGLAEEKTFTVDDIFNLPDGDRVELIDGIIYDMAPPGTKHQDIIGELYFEIKQYIRTHGGSCRIYQVPFGVFLDDDGLNYLEPDISIICDRNKIKKDGCHGAPDWIAEVLSPSTKWKDSYTKMYKYRSAGIREYWIIDPQKNRITVQNFEHETRKEYSFNDSVPVGIYDDFSIDFNRLDI